MTDTKTTLDNLIRHASKIILGKEHEIRLSLACLLARGHLLIEDLPGVGKTTLAHVLAQTLGLQYQRIQFTSDLLPADILGVSIFDKSDSGFHFHPGPIFAQLILADEVNRATPKAQSALLEAMEEGQVTTEGETRPLPTPFFVIATQNPTYQIGTFPLPESQLDRFLMRISLGYPGVEAERALLTGQDRRSMLKTLSACTDPAQLAELQSAADQIHASDALLDYIQALLTFSREAPQFAAGLSPRAGLALLHAAKAWALLDGRNHALPEDVQTVLPHVVGHRLRSATDDLEQSPETLTALMQSVAIP
ncbi:MAG: MoxR family ATPase [Ectothiorhodospiraceae bacterium]|nr:MoxR family ATPase [Ectothiorhodospiraceae bacterium]